MSLVAVYTLRMAFKMPFGGANTDKRRMAWAVVTDLISSSLQRW
jgi:hypothetical protein